MNVQKEILQRCHEDGTSLVQSAAEMREEDLHITEESIFESPCHCSTNRHGLSNIEPSCILQYKL
jgi:hypothetical protein